MFNLGNLDLKTQTCCSLVVLLISVAHLAPSPFSSPVPVLFPMVQPRAPGFLFFPLQLQTHKSVNSVIRKLAAVWCQTERNILLNKQALPEVLIIPVNRWQQVTVLVIWFSSVVFSFPLRLLSSSSAIFETRDTQFPEHYTWNLF